MFSDNFGTIITSSATYFLVVSALISLKVDTKGAFRVKKISKFGIFDTKI